VLLLALPVVLLVLGQFSIHRIQEGHVGVYSRGGALVPGVTEPGYHLMVPFIDSVAEVQVTVQTDKVMDIPCGTSGGVMTYIEKVEVVNRLKKAYVYDTIKNYTVHYDRIWIFDKIHHEINQFCSKHSLQEVYIDLFHTVDERLVQALQVDCDRYAPGIEIIAIRITKPKIPQLIVKNYEGMEAEKTKLLIATEYQRVVEKEAETDRKRATIEAEKNAAVSRIRMEQELLERESKRKMSEIEDTAYLSRQKALADAEFYRQTKAAEANAAMLSPAFLKLEMIRAIANNTKVYFGPAISSLYTDWMERLLPGDGSTGR
jgi:regulator of protease activity HflC (stomatin/prohibitin superfamily)